MTQIYNDPASGTYKSNYGSGVFGGTNGSGTGGTDPNWNTVSSATTNFNIDSGAGGNLIQSVASTLATCMWRQAATWTPITLGFWSEITLANTIGTSSAQVGPAVLLDDVSGAGTNAYGYIIRLRYNGANNGWTFFSYDNSSVTQVSTSENTYTAGATDVIALQWVYNSATSCTLTAFQNYATLGSITDPNTGSHCANIITHGGNPSGLWNFNGVSGSGDVAKMRGGTGLYPGSAGPPLPVPPGAKQTFVTETIFQF